MKRYSIIVNSTDSFSDCWGPFFYLFSKYWKPTPDSVILNTETKSYSDKKIKIISTKVGVGANRELSWSECLLKCLSQVDTEIVLYLQEDYFLKNYVGTRTIDDLADYMRENAISNIRLLECGNSGPWEPTEHPLLWKVNRKSNYLISLQAGLWRVSTLKKYLRKHETPWEFEIYGTKRIRRSREEILCVSRDLYNDETGQLVPYDRTGIIKGQWNKRAVVKLFEMHSFNMDFSKRGFFIKGEELADNKGLFYYIKRFGRRLKSMF